MSKKGPNEGPCPWKAEGPLPTWLANSFVGFWKWNSGPKIYNLVYIKIYLGFGLEIDYEELRTVKDPINQILYHYMRNGMP